MRLRDILTPDDLRQLEGAIGVAADKWSKEKPTGWAHAILIHARSQIAKSFDPDGDYDYYGLFNLRSSVVIGGIQEIAHRVAQVKGRKVIGAQIHLQRIGGECSHPIAIVVRRWWLPNNFRECDRP